MTQAPAQPIGSNNLYPKGCLYHTSFPLRKSLVEHFRTFPLVEKQQI